MKKHKTKFVIDGSPTIDQILESNNLNPESFERYINFLDKIMTDLPSSKKEIRDLLPKMNNKIFETLIDYAVEDNMIIEVDHSKFRKFTEKDRDEYGSIETIVAPKVWYLPNVTCVKIFYYFVVITSKPFKELKIRWDKRERG